ncbi:hypothetical protein ACG33_08060 [Steroidobacter denitrificans]|uniref:Uncharacterized protein n=1 Tax=Steroidobacter denitrificans TaxID=465721 RepID=A0A127FBS6_STEDE|nr:hypothetical protein ACG33_08060 [Steroidobacter denitrificans]
MWEGCRRDAPGCAAPLGDAALGGAVTLEETVAAPPAAIARIFSLEDSLFLEDLPPSASS